jgi:hypothetical protein
MFVKKVYTLKDSVIPEVTKTTVITDHGAGGVKLVYRVISFHHKQFKILGYKMPVPWPYKVKKEKQVFLNPYKEVWDSERNKTSRNNWGSPSNPLMTVWVKVEFDYSNIEEDIICFEEYVNDHELQRHFKKRTQDFEVVIEY